MSRRSKSNTTQPSDRSYLQDLVKQHSLPIAANSSSLKLAQAIKEHRLNLGLPVPDKVNLIALSNAANPVEALALEKESTRDVKAIIDKVAETPFRTPPRTDAVLRKMDDDKLRELLAGYLPDFEPDQPLSREEIQRRILDLQVSATGEVSATGGSPLTEDQITDLQKLLRNSSRSEIEEFSKTDGATFKRVLDSLRGGDGSLPTTPAACAALPAAQLREVLLGRVDVDEGTLANLSQDDLCKELLNSQSSLPLSEKTLSALREKEQKELEEKQSTIKLLDKLRMMNGGGGGGRMAASSSSPTLSPTRRAADSGSFAARLRASSPERPSSPPSADFASSSEIALISPLTTFMVEIPTIQLKQPDGTDGTQVDKKVAGLVQKVAKNKRSLGAQIDAARGALESQILSTVATGDVDVSTRTASAIADIVISQYLKNGSHMEKYVEAGGVDYSLVGTIDLISIDSANSFTVILKDIETEESVIQLQRAINSLQA